MDLKFVLVSDFEKVCRICMKFDKTLISINSLKIIDMITECFSVQIWENDALPNQICNGCFLQLQNTINFKQLCENSDNAFRQIIEQNDLTNVKNEELDNLNSPIYIKEEDDVDNVPNQKILGNVKTRIEDDSEKSEAKIKRLLEIKNGHKLELNKIQTRKLTIQYKFDEDSDGYENENTNTNEENDFDYEGEDEKSDLEDYNCEKSDLAEYNCETCSKAFKKVEALGLHMKKKHNAEGTKCRRCSLICYHQLHLRVHEKSHNKCHVCNLSFTTSKKLTQHKLTHDNEDIPELSCKMCPAKLTSKNSLYKHMRFLHKIETMKQSLKCDKCDETFTTKRVFEKHIRKMHPKAKIKHKEQVANCEICGKSLTRRNLRRHMLTHGDRDKIACEVCAKIFISQETLTNHIKIYHKNSEPVYKCLCNQCGHKFRSNCHLNKHLLTHTKERPYPCDKCDKTYRTLFQLKEHVSRIHLNERNFVCTYCSQAFYDKKILLNHVRRHTGEKPFKCLMCEKRFIQKVALNVHMKVHTNSI